MPEWLSDTMVGSEPLPAVRVLVARIGLALVLGLIVAGVYATTLGRRRETAALMTTLVLLSVLIALVTLVIGNSVARAFGLVGALSIVRFRTVVEDTRDTAFVIFAVVVGMAAGAGAALLAFIGIPIVAFAAAVMARLDREPEPRKGRPAHLTIRVGLNEESEASFGPLLAKHLIAHRLTGAGTAKQGSAIELVYEVRIDWTLAPTLVRELNRCEGVQGVELRRG